MRYKDAIPLFREYQKKWLNLSDKRFISEEDLYLDYPEADIYMVGSDQVWNVMPTGEICNTYYLDNLSDDKKKVSYAASFGSQEKIKNDLPFIKEKLSKFDCITVREEDGIMLLNSLGIKATLVLDPTLLLSSNEWRTLSKKTISIPHQYVLLYQVNRNKELCRLAEAISKKMNLKLVRISVDKSEKKWAKSYTYLPTPPEFLDYFSNASYIITDSFHGTCFSILLKIEFVVFLPKRYSERIMSLLKLFSLEDRVIEDKTQVEDIISTLVKSINWNKTMDLLQYERYKSFSHLKAMIFDRN